MSIRFNMIRRSAYAASLCVASVLAQPGVADSVQRGQLPTIDGITLIGVEKGQLKYRTAAGDRSVPLEEVNTLTIDSVPQFQVGKKAFAEGQMRAAQRAFEDVWSGSRVPWIKHYAGYYLTQVYDQRKQPVEAAQVYAQLAKEGADLFFMSKQPIASLDEASENQKKRMGDQLKAVIAEVRGDHKAQLQTFARRVLGEEIEVPVGPGVGNPNKGPDLRDLQAKSKVFLPKSVWAMLERKGEPKGKWDSIKLLSQGKYAETLEAMKPWLSNAGDLPEKLFIYGRAQLALAEAKDDKDLYRDAGLTFMRIVVHFNRAGQPHALVAPAQLETAYIHQKIGREDIYNRMLFGGEGGGGVHLVIDDKNTYPQYRKRYYQIIGEEIPAEDQP